MKARCYYHRNPSYKNYGARGIDICNEWMTDFTEFYNWAIENGWQRGLEIDRINVNIGYHPGNCRFVTRIVNSRNTRSNIRYTYNGETKCLAEWCQLFNVSYGVMYSRLTVLGWSVEQAFTTPIETTYTNYNLRKPSRVKIKNMYCSPCRWTGIRSKYNCVMYIWLLKQEPAKRFILHNVYRTTTRWLW